MLWSCADVKRGCVVAALADRLQLFDLLALRHQGDDGLEHGSHTSGVQGSNYDYLALVSCILTELSDLKPIPVKVYSRLHHQRTSLHLFQ